MSTSSLIQRTDNKKKGGEELTKALTMLFNTILKKQKDTDYHKSSNQYISHPFQNIFKIIRICNKKYIKPRAPS